jgi:hypothetical protein
MTLAVIYLDFCHHAWDESAYPDFLDWASALEVQPFQIGRLIGLDDAEKVEELEPWANESEFLSQAYLVLTDAERSKIHGALCDSQRQAVNNVYLDFHKSRGVTTEFTEDNAWEVTPGNCDAYEFVQNRFCRQRDYYI